LLGFDEVVVTGTSGGTQKKQLGNSISTVSANDLRNANALDVTAAISGKIAGAQVKVTSGAPAGAISVTLRGASTINSNAEPLYIIDGVIVDNSSNELVLVGSGGVQNRLVDLNPNDIDRIEILKGAAAAAIYGSRASNGVVQIFTKRGRSGAPRVTWRSNVLVNSIRQKLPVNTAPFRWADPSDNANLERIPTERFDYQDYIYKTGTGTENYLSVSGGSGTTSYFVSGSNFYNQGFVRNSDFNRTTVRANVDQILNSWSVLKVGSAFTRSFANDIPTGGTNFFDGAVTTLQFSPHEVDAAPDELGNYPSVGNAFFGNPNEIVDKYQYTQEVNRYTGSISLTMTPTKQWSIDGVLGYDGYTQVARGFKPVGTVSTPNGFSRRGDITTSLVNADLNTQYRIPLTESISSNTGAGFTYQYDKSESIINQAANLGPIVETVDGGTITSSSDVIAERSVRGAYLQETIGLNERIFFTVAGRFDGSSVFGENENTQFYPKASGAWILSEEGFWPKNAINEMKIRASYGQSGNLTGIGPYERFTNYNPVPFLGQTGLTPSTRLGDENIRPETQTEFEIGFDLAFLNSKLGVEFTYYDQKITDLLLQRVLSPSTGASSRIENVGELTNRGIEALIRATAIEKPGMGLRFFATFFKNSNKITNLDGPKFPIGNGNFSRQWAIEGQQLGVFYRAAYARDDNGDLLLTEPGQGGLPAALPQKERGNQGVYDACVVGEAFTGDG
ncbi:MAG: SusC/RagA family TonB-linked outer membrane protein, partial [Rhodothermia bacterium]